MWCVLRAIEPETTQTAITQDKRPSCFARWRANARVLRQEAHALYLAGRDPLGRGRPHVGRTGGRSRRQNCRKSQNRTTQACCRSCLQRSSCFSVPQPGRAVSAVSKDPNAPAVSREAEEDWGGEPLGISSSAIGEAEAALDRRLALAAARYCRTADQSENVVADVQGQFGLSFGHDIHWTILAQSLRLREQETNPYARELEVEAEQRVSKAQRQSAGT